MGFDESGVWWKLVLKGGKVSDIWVWWEGD